MRLWVTMETDAATDMRKPWRCQWDMFEMTTQFLKSKKRTQIRPTVADMRFGCQLKKFTELGKVKIITFRRKGK